MPVLRRRYDAPLWPSLWRLNVARSTGGPEPSDPGRVYQTRPCLLPDQLEEGDQFPGDALGCEQRGIVAQAWQRFADVQIGDVVRGVLL